MKTLIVTKMCMLYCALIVCSLASTARTNNTSHMTTADTNNNNNISISNSTTDEEHDDYVITPSPPTLKNSSTTIPSTPSVTDPNKLPQTNKTTTEGFLNSTGRPKPDNGNNLSGEKYNSSARILTNNNTWSKPETTTKFIPVTMKSTTMSSTMESTTARLLTKKLKKPLDGPTLSPITKILLNHEHFLDNSEEKIDKKTPRPKIEFEGDFCMYSLVRKYLNRRHSKATIRTVEQRTVKSLFEELEEQRREARVSEMENERSDVMFDVVGSSL